MRVQKELNKIYKSYTNYLAEKSLPPLNKNLDEILASIFCPGPFYYYIIDSPTLTFDQVSDSCKQILGEDFQGASVASLVERIHPDDIPFFLRCENIVADFLKNKITPDKIVQYKISYCLREKVKDGSYKLFLLQTVTLETTKEGALLKVMGVHSDISHITDTNNYKLSLIGLNGEPSYLGMKVDSTEYKMQPIKSPFTKRELEIIRLLGEGKTSNEIADNLFISHQTVTSHRKNALAKMGIKNSTQLVSHCIRNGYI